jgi:hypothetical protein
MGVQVGGRGRGGDKTVRAQGGLLGAICCCSFLWLGQGPKLDTGSPSFLLVGVLTPTGWWPCGLENSVC